MNINRLKELEKRFFLLYPKAFEDEEMQKHGKKHSIEKHHQNAVKVLAKDNFKNGLSIYEDVTKIVLKSTLVSVFEKVRFRDLVKEIDLSERHMFLDGVYELIHGDEEKGFQLLTDLLGFYKLAKWPIITIFRAYYFPNQDIFIKPTTVKNVIKNMEFEDISYSPKVNYEFYQNYRKQFNEMKQYVDSRLYPNNPAFSGFLMVTMN